MKYIILIATLSSLLSCENTNVQPVTSSITINYKKIEVIDCICRKNKWGRLKYLEIKAKGYDTWFSVKCSQYDGEVDIETSFASNECENEVNGVLND